MVTDDRPLAVDLCCGLGGWTKGLLAEGWRVMGFDITQPKSFPAGAQLVIQDIRTIDARPWRGLVSLIVASPPCTEFTYVWNFARHREPEPEKGIELVEHCRRIQREADCLMILENVSGARRYIGQADAHVGPYYFWGDVPLLMPQGKFRKGIWNTDRDATGEQRWKRDNRAKTYVRDPAARAEIPIEIARAVANQMKPPAALRPRR